MGKKKLIKKMLIIFLSAAMVLPTGNFAYANIQALPNGTIISQDGNRYLADSNGKKYSGWFIDSKEDWYYFNESDLTMKTGWHQDDNDGYSYYLNLSDGKMVTGWQTINGKEYFFQPVRDMGNYHFNNEQEKWLYNLNSKVPYGAMYVNTMTPDGIKVDSTGSKVTTANEVTDTVKNGWISQNGKWYFYESNILAKNKWLNLSGKWYYVVADGSMASSGWEEIGGKSYYFGSDGVMYVNTTTPDGSKVNTKGEKETSNASVEAQNYIGKYIGDYYAGYYIKRVITITDAKAGILKGTFYEEYRLQEDSGIISVDSFEFSAKLNDDSSFNFNGYDFCFVSWKGELAILPMISRQGFLAGEQGDFFLCGKQDGVKSSDQSINSVQEGWTLNNGKWYYYEADVMAKNKWLDLSGKWYYVTGDGSMVSNSWKDIGGKSYYFGSDGAMYVNTTTPDGYNVGDDGERAQKIVKDYSRYNGTYAPFENSGWASLDIQIEDNKVSGNINVGSIQGSNSEANAECSFQGIEIIDNHFSLIMEEIQPGYTNVEAVWEGKEEPKSPGYKPFAIDFSFGHDGEFDIVHVDIQEDCIYGDIEGQSGVWRKWNEFPN